MDTKEVIYPVFEANQVLSSAHLNELFEYLDEQTRLTRANLVGIGIVCGLDVTFERPLGPVHLSRGCGVTSQGYLVVQPVDLTLAYVRPYKLPREYGYEPFMEPGGGEPAEQFDLWELLPDDDEPGATSLAKSGLPLDHKVVVLFVELTKDRLRNCSPNNCDDRGSAVTSTVRRLLVDLADLDKVIDVANPLAPSHVGADLTDRLRLPDLRMPRVDVPNSGPVSSESVLQAFQDTFRRSGLAGQTAEALKALYEAFSLVVQDSFDDNPFLGFAARFDFLDTIPTTISQVRFMQYYWDLFDDILTAYDEVRWTGVDLLCACCPPEGLFPRHLMAGVLAPELHDAAGYRHRFVRSPALGDCVDRTREVQLLFGRLVALVDGFTETPPDKGVRATPSRWGDAPLSAKAIPYYYGHTGTPPAFQLWDPRKSARGRANQSLSYRADDYTPTPPAFVTDPLRFDLEPNDFLRIEGHLGKDVQTVLKSLLLLKKSHRLPIEVVAMRTGMFDENVEIDLSTENCRFRDLETLYGTLKAEMACFLGKEVQYFTSLPVGEAGDEMATSAQLQNQSQALVSALSEIGSILADDIRQVDFAVLGEGYRALVEIAHEVDEARKKEGYDHPSLSDRLDDIVFRCRIDPFEALADEYKRRIREAKEATFLGHYLEHHPGVQHKAGVPLGGTFILVYHELPASVASPSAPEVAAAEASIAGQGGVSVSLTTTFQLDEPNAKLLNTALARMPYKGPLAEDPDVQLLYKLVTGDVLVPRSPVPEFDEQIYLDAIAGLSDGAVIADFFLPYQCCSDCTPIQYQLPPPRLRVSASPGCTNAEGFSEVALTVEAASGPLMVQVDDAHPQELGGGSVSLQTGDHTIVVRDATGAESSPLDISVPAPLVISGSEKSVDEVAGTYQVVAHLQGGTPPYASDVGTIVDSMFTSMPVPIADSLAIVVKDAIGCTVEDTHESGVKPCDLPCGGAAVRQGFRFWIPEARLNLPIKELSIDPVEFVVVDPTNGSHDLTAQVGDILQRFPKDAIRTADFAALVKRWLDGINEEVSRAVGSDLWLQLEYEPPTDRGTTGVLFADRLDCVEFHFSLRVSYSQGGPLRTFELGYSSSGTDIAESQANSNVQIPPFRESTSNKCRPDEPPKPRCDATDLKLSIERSGGATKGLVLGASFSGSDSPVAFLWELQDGIPSMAGGEKISPTFQPVEPVDKLVRLTAVTAKSCMVTIEETVQSVFDVD
jgi:hypothetical protein